MFPRAESLVAKGLLPGFALSASMLFAQAPSGEVPGPGDTPAETDDEIIIQADAVDPAVLRRGRTGATTVIELGGLRNRYATVADVLERESSIRVNRYGGRGAYATVSLRGSNPNQVNIFIDGIPLTNAVAGEVNLADLNPDAFERIEIYRSGDFPGSAIGGSINLVSRSDGGGDGPRAGVRLRSIFGSFRTFGLGADVFGSAFGGSGNDDANGGAGAADSGAIELDPGLRYSVTARGETSDQNYRFRNDNGTPVINESDDFDDRRKNAQYKNYFLTMNLGYDWGRTRFGLLNDSVFRRNGVPGPTPAQSEKPQRRFLRNTTGLSSDTKGLGFDWLRLQTRAYYTEARERFQDPRAEFSSAQPNSRSRLQQYGLHLEPTLYLLDYYQTLRIYLAAERETFRQDRRDRFDQFIRQIPTKFRSHYTARLEDEIAFWNERIVITPAIESQRYVDRFNDTDANFFDLSQGFNQRHRSVTEYTNYRVGGRFVPYRGDVFEAYLKAGADSGRRVPLFLELFGEQGSIIGNPDLQPERSESVEAGPGVKVDHEYGRGSLEIIAFRRIVRDLILFVPNSQFTLRPENVDAADIRGVELSAQLDLLDMFKGDVSYTYQAAINQSDVQFLRGRYLPLRPLHEMTAALSYYNDSIEVGGEAAYVGAVFRDRTNEPTAYVGPRWLFHLFASWNIFEERSDDGRINEKLSVGLELRNVFNERVVDIAGFPLPGRAIYGVLSYQF